MVEFHVVALFALLPLCLGGLQMALLASENHHLDHATFLAARHAAMEHGEVGSARRALARAATVLFVRADADLAGSGAAPAVARAYAAALADQALHARVRVLNPTPEAQQDFALLRNGDRVIPNDALEHRDSAPGPRSGLTLQQASMLRLEVSWCRPLVVPFARHLLLGALRTLDRDPWRQGCYARGRVPIRSVGTSPMQSDFRVSS